MRRSAAFVTAVTLFLGLLAPISVASPAQAYGNLTVRYAVFDPITCHVFEGNLPVVLYFGRCRTDYFIDGGSLFQLFTEDANSRAMAVDIRNTNGTVAIVEFHPYDEWFYIFDTADDGDTIYVDVWKEAPSPRYWDPVGVYRAPGTSADVDILYVNLSIADGSNVFLGVYDDADLTDPIDSYLAVA